MTVARIASRLAAALLVTSLLASLAYGQEGPSSGEIELESRVFEVARQLRCPTCVSESVADSNARISIEMRQQIHEQLQAGRSEAEILAFFQERYGDWILLEPPREGLHVWVWLLPGIALAAGAGGLTLLLVRWTRATRREADQAPPPEEDLARVRAALSQEERDAP